MPMPNQVKVFPRGYSGGQSIKAPTHQPRDGDAEIEKLFAEYCGPAAHTKSWEFRRKVIAAAKRLMSGTNNWFIQQDSNPMVDAYNYQFLVDTLRYIATGRRRISIHSWPDLMSHGTEVALVNVTARRDIIDTFADLALSMSIDALIQKWCSHPGGFDDFMYSLNILFGEAHLKNEQPSA